MIKKYKYSRKEINERWIDWSNSFSGTEEDFDKIQSDLLATVPDRKCKSCKGLGSGQTGEDEWGDCSDCNGTGMVNKSVPTKECEHKKKWKAGKNTQGEFVWVCPDCKESVVTKEDCEHQYTTLIHGHLAHTNCCLKCKLPKPTPPQLPVIKKIQSVETKRLVQGEFVSSFYITEDGGKFLMDKINEVIDRVNLLSQRVCKKK